MYKYWERAWNPILGCSGCSEGCNHCFAMELAERRCKAENKVFNPHIRINHKQLIRNFNNSPELIMVCSQSDLFHENISDDVIDSVIRKCRNNQQKRFLVLTKRAERMFDYLADNNLIERLNNNHINFNLDNIIFGVTVECNKYLNRIDFLKKCPNVKNKFVAFEPLLEKINDLSIIDKNINWVVVGCENGNEKRDCSLEWIEQIKDDCLMKKIPVYINNINLNDNVISNCQSDLKIFENNINPFII